MADKDKDNSHWMEDATAKMKSRGTLGSFGPATPKKIAAGIAAGGKQEKKALFAKNVAKSARKRA